MDNKKKIDITLRIIESLTFIVSLFFSMKMMSLISACYEDTYLIVFCINIFAFGLSALNAKGKNKISFFKFVSASVYYLIMTLPRKMAIKTNRTIIRGEIDYEEKWRI